MSLIAPLKTAIVAAIEAATHAPFRAEPVSPVSGGSINAAYSFGSPTQRWFVKVNRAERLPMFEAEAAGLRVLRVLADNKNDSALAIPDVLTHGNDAEHAWLVLEWLDLAPRTNVSDAALGSALAQLHRCTAPQFGFERDNWLGATPQRNAFKSDWVAFFREQRLGDQIELAANTLGANAPLVRLGEQLLNRLEGFFVGYTPMASLLHGDLWSGNAAATNDGKAAIFDPAPYFGDRETDIAMTQLFGGFSAAFYAAYRESWPLDAGFALRRDLYNLYHVLNHFNLFGSGYADQARAIMQGLLAEI